ncbi:hypothetical protein Trydic_g4118 [Trypoxylus dichotomus]
MTKFYWCVRLILVALIFRASSSIIIIVGTGPSGIAAATRLLKNNVTDILILEAENRIGGRINSIEFGSAFVDMGAEWCHGQDGNIVYDFIKDYNVLQHTNLWFRIFYSDGQPVDINFSKRLIEIIEGIYTPDGNKKQKEGVTLGEYCINSYHQAINSLNLTDIREKKIANDFLGFFQRYVISSEGAFSWFEPSAESDYRDCPGDLALNWNGFGFKTILELMMQKFPNTSTPLPIDDKIVLNKEVRKIVWDSKDDDVIVKCADGSWYHGERVIFTPSLGVLKERHRYMFEPQLPMQKQIAIEKLGIGAVMKIMLLFEKHWWPDTFTGASFVWSTEHGNVDYHKFTKLGRVWVFDALGLFPVANDPNVLSFWFTGTCIPIIEQLDKVEVEEGVNFLLDLFVKPIYNITYPISFIKSQWYTNPHFRGTYSYQTTASRQMDGNEILGRPLSNRNGKTTLMFAGEATHPHHYSTVHGAIESGYREADRVLKILKEKSMRSTTQILLVSLVSLVCTVNGLNVLGIFEIPVKSWHILGHELLVGLAKRGYNVTLISPFPVEQKIANYTHLYIDGALEHKERNIGTMLQENWRGGAISMLNIISDVVNMTLHSKMMSELLESDNKFDVIILAYMHSEAMLALSHHFDARVIAFIPFSTMPHITRLTGNSAPYSYVPLPFFGYTDEMSFLQRTMNTLVGLLGSWVYTFYFYPQQEKIFKERFPLFPPLEEIERERVDLTFCNSHFSSESPRPQTPNIVHIAGYHVQEPEPLTVDVQRILDSAPEGVVFLAFGTHVDMAKLPKEKMDAFLHTFSKIPYKVLLKYDGIIPDKPRNVETIAWVPQRGVLAHPNVKIFISHGGKGSATESLYYGVPVLCVSFFGDQWNNCEDIAEHNYGIHLPFQDVTKDTFEEAFSEIDDNPKYKENAKYRSTLFREQEMDPMERAIFWIEHIHKFKGAKHLRPKSTTMPLYQYLLLDKNLICNNIMPRDRDKFRKYESRFDKQKKKVKRDKFLESQTDALVKFLKPIGEEVDDHDVTQTHDDVSNEITPSSFHGQKTNSGINESLVDQTTVGSISVDATHSTGNEGYSDWAHLGRALDNHEKSAIHGQNVGKWTDCEIRLAEASTIDKQHMKLINKEKEHWREVLKRIVSGIKYLAQHNIAFRDRTLNFTQEHLRRIRSSEIHDQEQIFKLLSGKVKEEIVSDIKAAKYFSVLLDCTPDLSQQEQL